MFFWSSNQLIYVGSENTTDRGFSRLLKN